MKKRQKTARRFWNLRNIVISVSVLFSGALVLSVVGMVEVIKHTPISIGKLTASPQPTIVYDSSGKVYMKIGSAPMNLKYNQIPANLRNALVATEDHSFWTGSSIDFKSILRSMYVDVMSGSAAQGASTIEEQLAKIVYLNDNKTLSYKIKEMAMGVQIDRYFTKQQILDMYLNKVFLGENSIGVGQAAMRYFGINLAKNPNKLTLDEAALLAGLPQAPSGYDPLAHPKAALQRRNQVLQNMAKYGYITQQQAKAAEQKPLVAKYHALGNQTWNTHPLFTNILFDYAAKQGISSQQLLQGGLKIYTTIDPKVQNAVYQVFWDKQYNQDFPGPVEGAAVFVNPQTGGIEGAAGSRKTGFAPFGTDRIYSDSSPGSSIKPIMEYAPAIQSGKWTPSSILHNQPQNFGGGYTPQNWEGVRGPTRVTLKYGLEWSQNIASVWLLQQIGIKTGTSFAMKDGIKLTASDKEHLGVAIGGMQYGVNPLEMAQAYEPFDDNGMQMKAHLISKITNQEGQTTFQFHPVSKVIMSPQTAAIMTQLMEDVVNAGTGTAARIPGWGVAGKTGTVQYGADLQSAHPNWIRDAWFDGYTPNLVGAVHIGYDISSPQHHMTMSPLDPSANAAKIFAAVIRLAEQGTTPEQFSNLSIKQASSSTTTNQNNNTASNNSSGNTVSGNNTTITANTTTGNNSTSGSTSGNTPTNSTSDNNVGNNNTVSNSTNSTGPSNSGNPTNTTPPANSTSTGTGTATGNTTTGSNTGNSTVTNSPTSNSGNSTTTTNGIQAPVSTKNDASGNSTAGKPTNG